eukprot:1079236-Rhodomonas_salina.2
MNSRTRSSSPQSSTCPQLSTAPPSSPAASSYALLSETLTQSPNIIYHTTSLYLFAVVIRVHSRLALPHTVARVQQEAPRRRPGTPPTRSALPYCA